MKTKVIFVIFLLTVTKLFSQINYYSWNTAALNWYAPGARGDGLAFAENSALYYTVASNDQWSPNDICKISYPGWTYEKVGLASSEKPKTNSVFVYGDWKLFYTDVNGILRNLYKTGATWNRPALYGPASNPVLPVSRGDGLIFVGNSTLYFTTSSNTICKVQWNAAGWWDWSIVGLTASYPVKAGSALAYGDGKLFYVATDSKIYNTYQIGSTWYLWSLANTPDARGEGLVFGNNSTIYYTATDGYVYYCQWNSSTGQWPVSATNKTLSVKNGSNLVFNNDRIFFGGNDNKANILFKGTYECEWTTKSLNDDPILDGSKLAFGDYKPFYIESVAGNYKVCNLYPKIDPASFPYSYLRGKTFYLNSAPFFPKVMNYIVNVNTDDASLNTSSTYWVGPHHGYSQYGFRCCNDQTSAYNEMVNDFTLIASKGFNAVRVMGMALWTNDPVINGVYDYTDPHIYLKGLATTNLNPFMKQVDGDNLFQQKIFSMSQSIINAASQAGLKVIFITGQGRVMKSSRRANYGNFLTSFSASCSTNTNLLAYDLYNEPGIENYDNQDKADNCQVFKSWYDAVRISDINHLITVGLIAPGDLEQFDPELISLDFHSFHFYPYATYTDPTYDEMLSTITWIKNNITKPWIVGETGFAALDGPEVCATYDNPNITNGWGTENDQKNYALTTQSWVRQAGGSGYSWWAYKDVADYSITDFENYWGMFTKCNRAKPVSNHFSQNFLDNVNYPCSGLPFPTNYYNVDGDKLYILNGIVKDEFGTSIKDAYIDGFNVPNGWTNLGSTFSKPDGSFSIYTTQPVTLLRVTATKKVVTDFQITGSYSSVIPHVLNVKIPFSIAGIESCTPSGNKKFITTNNNEDVPLKVGVYPNPSSGIFNIQLENNSKKSQLEVFDMTGKKITSAEIYNNYSLDLTGYSKGIYIVKINTNDKQVVKKIILE